MFNVVVDNMVRTCLLITVEDQTVAQEGLGLNVGIFLGVLYAKDFMIRVQDSEWIKNAHNITVLLLISQSRE